MLSAESNSKRKPGFGIDLVVYLIFFLSGAAALVLEISWARQVGLLFGHSIYAASIVLTSYFAGLALGNWLGGRWASRVSPLVGYAAAETVVAGWAILIPTLLSLAESPRVAPWFSSSSFAWQTSTRAFFSFALLLPATTAMGATLPFVAQFFSNRHDVSVSPSVGISKSVMAYALNTTGALIGTVAATFFLLVWVGVSKSGYLAAGVCLVCAGLANQIRRVERQNACLQEPAEKTECDGTELTGEAVGSGSVARHLLFLSAFSGFGTLSLQVLYTRMFSLVFHNSTYTFGIVIVVFLASLAAGAALVSKLRRRFDARTLMGFATGMGGIAIASSVVVFVGITKLEYYSSGQTFVSYIRGAMVLVIVVVTPAIICLGMMLPLTWAMADCNRTTGNVVGRLTSVNTLAAAFGAMAASFFLLPFVGLWQSFVVFAIGYFAISFVLLWSVQQRIVACVFGIVLGVVTTFVLNSPVESQYSKRMMGERLVQRWNSAYGWIDVVQRMSDEAFKIRQNLHYRFGATGTNAREFRQSHLPLLLCENPERVLFMGLGTGLTAGGAIPFPNVEEIVAVELIPEVVEAARTLSDYNFRVADHPKVEIAIDDARHFLLSDAREYDLIVSDLFVPWESETGYLYTVENYEVARRRLKSDGLYCQWLPLYQLGRDEFELIANSFAKVFPHTSIWWGEVDADYPIVALIGASKPLELRDEKLALRMRALKLRLGRVDHAISTPELFGSLYIGDWHYAAGSRLNTDEHPRVEFLTPISNRNRELVCGENLKAYFDNVFSQLPSDSVRLSGPDQLRASERLKRQRLSLFGTQ